MPKNYRKQMQQDLRKYWGLSGAEIAMAQQLWDELDMDHKPERQQEHASRDIARRLVQSGNIDDVVKEAREKSETEAAADWLTNPKEKPSVIREGLRLLLYGKRSIEGD